MALAAYMMGVRLISPVDDPAWTMRQLALPITVVVLATFIWCGGLNRRGGTLGAALVAGAVGMGGVLALQPNWNALRNVVPVEFVLWLAGGLAGGLASEAIAPRKRVSSS